MIIRKSRLTRRPRFLVKIKRGFNLTLKSHSSTKSFCQNNLSFLLFVILRFWGSHCIAKKVDEDDTGEAVDPQQEVRVFIDLPVAVSLEQGEGHEAVGQQKGYVEIAKDLACDAAYGMLPYGL